MRIPCNFSVTTVVDKIFLSTLVCCVFRPAKYVHSCLTPIRWWLIQNFVVGLWVSTSFWESLPIADQHTFSLFFYMSLLCSWWKRWLRLHRCLKYTTNVIWFQIFVCPQTLNVTLPRCGHPAKVPCETAQNLRSWSGNSATMSDLKSKGKSFNKYSHDPFTGTQDSIEYWPTVGIWITNIFKAKASK